MEKKIANTSEGRTRDLQIRSRARSPLRHGTSWKAGDT